MEYSHATAAAAQRAIVLSNDSKQPARGEVAHQFAGTEGPRRRPVAGRYYILQGAQTLGGDNHTVADVVGESRAWRIAVLDRREHRSQEQNEAVGVLMVGAD